MKRCNALIFDRFAISFRFIRWLNKMSVTSKSAWTSFYVTKLLKLSSNFSRISEKYFGLESRNLNFWHPSTIWMMVWTTPKKVWKIPLKKTLKKLLNYSNPWTIHSYYRDVCALLVIRSFTFVHSIHFNTIFYAHSLLTLMLSFSLSLAFFSTNLRFYLFCIKMVFRVVRKRRDLNFLKHATTPRKYPLSEFDLVTWIRIQWTTNQQPHQWNENKNQTKHKFCYYLLPIRLRTCIHFH